MKNTTFKETRFGREKWHRHAKHYLAIASCSPNLQFCFAKLMFQKCVEMWVPKRLNITLDKTNRSEINANLHQQELMRLQLVNASATLCNQLLLSGTWKNSSQISSQTFQMGTWSLLKDIQNSIYIMYNFVEPRYINPGTLIVYEGPKLELRWI